MSQYVHLLFFFPFFPLSVKNGKSTMLAYSIQLPAHVDIVVLYKYTLRGERLA